MNSSLKKFPFFMLFLSLLMVSPIGTFNVSAEDDEEVSLEDTSTVVPSNEDTEEVIDDTSSSDE
jgi:hypothetical protein